MQKYEPKFSGERLSGLANYKVKENDKTEKVKVLVYDMNPDGRIVSYATGELAQDDFDSYIVIPDDHHQWKLYEKKPSMHGVVGYIPVGDNSYVAFTKSNKGVLWFILLGILGAMLGLWLSYKPAQIIINGDPASTSTPTNDKTVNASDIPEFIEEVQPSDDMAYITGNSRTVVKESYKNVYLQNDKDNELYELVYEVYVNGSTECSYTTGKIPAGQAEPWNAYDCSDVHNGENDILYEVYIYDKEGNQVAQTTLSGLTLIKQ